MPAIATIGPRNKSSKKLVILQLPAFLLKLPGLCGSGDSEGSVQWLRVCLQVRWAGLQAASWAQVCPRVLPGAQARAAAARRGPRSAREPGETRGVTEASSCSCHPRAPVHITSARPSHLATADTQDEGTHSSFCGRFWRST